MRIKRADGAIIEVNDDAYVLQDGETLMTELRFMDAQRSMIHDSRGQPAGQRPGFLFCNDDVDHAVRETSRRMYIDDIEQRWRSDRWQSGPQNAKPSAPQTSLAGDAAVAESYRQYAHDVSNRWKHR